MEQGRLQPALFFYGLWRVGISISYKYKFCLSLFDKVWILHRCGNVCLGATLIVMSEFKEKDKSAN